MNGQGDLLLSSFNEGDRVRTSASTLAWLAGDRFGEVTKIGHAFVHVRMDASGKVRRMAPENLEVIS